MALAAGLLGAPALAPAQVPTLAIDDVVVNPEGDTGTTNATFTISLSAASSSAVTVKAATTNGTAVAPADYAPVTLTTLTIPAGATSTTVDVAVNGDVVDEIDETFQVQLSAPENASIADASGLGTIVDDDPPPSVSVNDASIAEGTGTSRTLVFTVTLSRASGKLVTVDYATRDETAISIGSPTDYVTRTGTLTFAAGVTTLTVGVTIQTDAIDELDETFFLDLALPAGANATLADATGRGTILDDDGPTIVVNDVTVVEGNAGTTDATFTVTLSAASVQPVSVKVATANDTAFAPADYTALAAGTIVTVPAGATTATVVVPVLGDVIDEADERFRVSLTEPTGGTLADASGQATITDDDELPSLRIDDATVNEGSVGTSSVTLTVSLSELSGRTVGVAYATGDGTATAGVDYGTVNDVLAFAAGQRQRTITILIGADERPEDDETFTVTLSNPTNATLAKAVGTVTISDDDLTPATAPRLSVADVDAAEGDAGTKPLAFTVSLSAPPSRTVGVSYATADATATAPADYAPAAGRLVFAPGETTKTVQTTVNGDTKVEGNHSFTLTLSDPSNATLGDASATATIVDDDIGDGPITVPSSVASSRMFCRTRKRCTGLRVGWTVLARGKLVYELTAIGTRAVRTKGSRTARPATRVRTFRILKTTSTIRRPRSGRRTLRPTPGRGARRLLARLRRDRARTLRLKVTFISPAGEERSTIRTVRLKLFR